MGSEFRGCGWEKGDCCVNGEGGGCEKGDCVGN
jgi:hypothetical protein